MEKKTYTIVGFTDLTKMADFFKEDIKTMEEVENIINTIKNDNYKHIVIRKETEEYGVEISTVIKVLKF